MIENVNLFPLTSRARGHHVIINSRRPVDIYGGAIIVEDGPYPEHSPRWAGLQIAASKLNEGNPKKPYKVALLEDEFVNWGVNRYRVTNPFGEVYYTHGVDDETKLGHIHNREPLLSEGQINVIQTVHRIKNRGK